MKRFIHGRPTAARPRTVGGRPQEVAAPLSDLLGPETAELYTEWHQQVDDRVRRRLVDSAERMPVRTGRSALGSLKRTPALAAIVALLIVSTALAVANGVNLGSPTNDAPAPYEHLDGFRPVGPVLRDHGKVEVLVFETLWDGGSALDRWPIVKSLAQFGSWTGLGKGTTTEPLPPNRSNPGFLAGSARPNPGVPTFELSHATYRSSYVVLVHPVLQTHSHTPIKRLPGREEALFQRVLRLPQLQERDYPMPAVVAGGYGMHGAIDDPSYALYNESAPGSSEFYTFDMIQRAMQAGDSGTGLGFLVREFNSYANVLTALICHADGQKPGSVCQHAAIRTILKQVK